jgi:hypothetical protein
VDFRLIRNYACNTLAARTCIASVPRSVLSGTICSGFPTIGIPRDYGRARAGSQGTVVRHDADRAEGHQGEGDAGGTGFGQSQGRTGGKDAADGEEEKILSLRRTAASRACGRNAGSMVGRAGPARWWAGGTARLWVRLPEPESGSWHRCNGAAGALVVGQQILST